MIRSDERTGSDHGGAADQSSQTRVVDIRRQLLMRLRRIEGQVRGLQRMVAEERGCVEVLAQVAAVHGALRSAERHLVRSHLQNCVRNAVAYGDSEGVERAMADVLDIVQRRES